MIVDVMAEALREKEGLGWRICPFKESVCLLPVHSLSPHFQDVAAFSFYLVSFFASSSLAAGFFGFFINLSFSCLVPGLQL